jgi:hypothetical protein
MAAAKKMSVSMPVSALCTELVVSAIGAGYVKEDFAVLLARTGAQFGITLESEEQTIDDGLSGGQL